MNGMCIRWFGCVAVAMLCVGQSDCEAQPIAVNGDSYAAPSVYLTPPVAVYDPAFLVPTQTVILPTATYVAPARVIYLTPTYISQPVVSYQPVGVFVPAVAPVAYRERLRYKPREMKYQYREYVPGRAAPVYSYKIEAERNRVKIRERIR